MEITKEELEKLIADKVEETFNACKAKNEETKTDEVKTDEVKNEDVPEKSEPEKSEGEKLAEELKEVTENACKAKNECSECKKEEEVKNECGEEKKKEVIDVKTLNSAPTPTLSDIEPEWTKLDGKAFIEYINSGKYRGAK